MIAFKFMTNIFTYLLILAKMKHQIIGLLLTGLFVSCIEQNILEPAPPYEPWQIKNDTLVYYNDRNAWYDYTQYALIGTGLGDVVGITFSEISVLNNYIEITAGVGDYVAHELYQSVEITALDGITHTYDSIIQTNVNVVSEIVELFHSNDSLDIKINHYDVSNDSLVMFTTYRTNNVSFTELYNQLN